MNQLQCSVDEFVDDQDYHTSVAPGILAVNQAVFELSVPASALHLSPTGFLNAWNDTASPTIEETTMIEVHLE